MITDANPAIVENFVHVLVDHHSVNVSFNSLSPILNCVDFRVAGLAILRCK